MSTGNRYASLWDRLCAKIEIESCGCWTWLGPVRRHGGGDRPAVSLRLPDKPNPVQRNAARLMCELIHGPAPTPEHEASHLCDEVRLYSNWLCISPDHLIWETKAENMARTRKQRKLELQIETWDAPGYKPGTIEPPF